MKNKLTVAFSWNELPAYAARLLHAGIKNFGQPVSIIGTKPQVPIKGMDEILEQKIYWIDKSKINSWNQLGLPVPQVFFQAGTYYISSFRKLGDEVRKNGGRVILLSDNNKKNNVRQFIGSILFNLFFKNFFSAVWVPGKSGEKLMQLYGFSKSKIYKGLYGSDSSCFTLGRPLYERPKKFIFVGKLNYLKGVHTLIAGYKSFLKTYPDWNLTIYGEGEYIDLVQSCPGVTVYPFAQPLQIAKAMRESRFLVLTSILDHWPLVVSEAALSGCGMILSNNVGNLSEFLNQKNGFSFPASSEKNLSKSFEKAALLSKKRLKETCDESFRLGSGFTTEEWSKNFCKIIADMRHQIDNNI